MGYGVFELELGALPRQNGGKRQKRIAATSEAAASDTSGAMARGLQFPCVGDVGDVLKLPSLLRHQLCASGYLGIEILVLICTWTFSKKCKP